ncbi:hypothetical protein [Paramaledivibacter caminithermalis]|jgi:hypothetical protein|uniref:Uncharacterized protein n=1 Tax=Paramaledivibacter caminithermalis (strain DSM 15212 / CIP 107654 / DViRD3) TaxID=1121301 RepID=A0A1M6RZ41_PARC5|nr:hypothetical protein [Paramaledivibacter caminithermalis]SHK37723.1 hypothetical protein SAMN02745912_03123 [Paramaledivibacter caminithermalis DSM 15212]
MNSFDKIDIYAKIGDLKDIDYRNTLAIATLVELLVEKGIITRQEFSHKAYILDNMSTEELKSFRSLNR